MIAPFVILLGALGYAHAAEKFIDLIQISDTHIADFRGVHPDLVKARAANATSLAKFEDFADEFAKGPKATLVHTGDIVDAVCFDGADGKPVYGQIDLVKRVLRRVRHKHYFALGNHDVECYRRDAARPASAIGDQSVATEARRLWGREFGFLRKSSYYSVPLKVGRQRYRLYMLDNGQALERGGREYLLRQMAWLRAEMRKRPTERVIAAVHVPITNDERSRFLRESLLEASGDVLLLCGHLHSDQLSRLEGNGKSILSVRTAAMMGGAGKFRRIRLKETGVVVYETGPSEKVAATF
jgi:predicted MPP superfamily phosphohydrolase